MSIRQWSRMGNLLSCSGVRDRGTKREFASRRVRKSSEARFDFSDAPNIDPFMDSLAAVANVVQSSLGQVDRCLLPVGVFPARAGMNRS